jgi:non-homologous end joining protein Ku
VCAGAGQGQRKVYVLLRDALKKANGVAIAQVVSRPSSTWPY